MNSATSPSPAPVPAPTPAPLPAATAAFVAQFIAQWQGASGTEISTSQSFIIGLCDVLGVPRPHATAEQDYLFERGFFERKADGSSNFRRVDCYRRGCFVWESKKLDASAAALRAGRRTRGFDEKIELALRQAEGYARNLPASEGRPPFVVVADIGHFIELYAEFTRSGANYTPFPDARSHRIALADLARPEVRQRLRALWLDPLSLDPARASARVTRQVAAELAALAKSFEAAQHAPQKVAAFLTRALFSMFAEDIGLLPPDDEGLGGFVALLQRYRTKPEGLQRMLQVLWRGMDEGGINGALEGRETLRFNGKLFKGWNTDDYVLPLNTEQVDGLLRAARANWREVEPAIFGTLLERALNPEERHALGAHYTPRAYVERLVLPTVVEPLRADWADAQAAALVHLREAETLPKGKKRESALAAARAEIKRFHHQLCSTRVLDPACGSGNFLYVTLEHLKRLEGEVLNRLEHLGHTQAGLGWTGETVTVAQLLGIEINPRAAALAELVLWIGWLQWQVRTSGLGSVAEPVVHDYGNIQCRDAVLAYASQELATHPETGQPLTRWDGKTTRPHPVTGEAVPDENAQVPQWRYVQPRPAEWPQAEFIVGNPPFIGKLKMRDSLGDGYVEALRKTWHKVPDSADFVMYWWNIAAAKVREGDARRFGLITTNSLRQAFNRRIVEAHMGANPPLGIEFAIPDHPWVDTADGAAVRIAMTVGVPGNTTGRRLSVESETASDETDEVAVKLEEQRGQLHADLRIGANIAAAATLQAAKGVTSMGVMLAGSGFIVDTATAEKLRSSMAPALHQRLIREYRNGRDLTESPRGAYVIDTFGWGIDELRAQAPQVFQHLTDAVKPERDANRDKAFREKWWLHGRARPDLRQILAGLPRYIATVETAKHRTFQFLDTKILPDHKIIGIALSDATHLGTLSSVAHGLWATTAGGRMGVGNDPVYNKSRCFETFPFPAEDTGLTPALAQRIGELAEAIDAHRKRQQAAHPETLTLTGLYNVLEALRAGRPLSAKEKALHEQGLVSVLRSLHDELDAAVLAAYGWQDLAAAPVPVDELLTRLVALNARRAAEEATGTIRWLRPEFQDPARRAAAAAEAAAQADLAPAAPDPVQASLPHMPPAQASAEAVAQTAAQSAANSAAEPEDAEAPAGPSPTTTAAPRLPWPASLQLQVRALADALAASPAPLSEHALAERFTGRGPWKKSLPALLDVLESLGRAQRVAGSGEGGVVWAAAG